MTGDNVLLKGGGFLTGEPSATDVFTPEEFGEEERLIGKTALEFVENEVCPQLDEIERGNHALTVELLKHAGRPGLLGGRRPR